MSKRKFDFLTYVLMFSVLGALLSCALTAGALNRDDMRVVYVGFPLAVICTFISIRTARALLSNKRQGE